MSVSLSHRSKKRGFKNAANPYHAVGNNAIVVCAAIYNDSP